MGANEGRGMKAIIVALCASIAFSLGFAPSAQATGYFDSDVVVSLQMSQSDARISKMIDGSDYVWTCKAKDPDCRIVREGNSFVFRPLKGDRLVAGYYAYEGSGAFIEREWDGSPLPLELNYRLPGGKKMKLTLFSASAGLDTP